MRESVINSVISRVRRVVLIVAVSVMICAFGWWISGPVLGVMKACAGRISQTVSGALIGVGLGTREVIVRGNHTVDMEGILRAVDRDKPIVFLSLSKLRNRIKSYSPWIKKAVVRRNLTGSVLSITIEEYVAFANWQHNGVNSIIDNTGHTIVESDRRVDNLVSIYGDTALDGLHFVREVVGDNGVLSTMVSSFSWLGNRRWDVNFSSGLQVKLPEKDPQAAWNYLVQLHRTSGELLMWQMIDMRIPDKIFIKR
ncbi:MAG: cell division protein FtsQ/DivIB [Anaplasma sp.]